MREQWTARSHSEASSCKPVPSTDESLEGVSWFRPIALGDRREAVTFLGAESRTGQAHGPLSVVVILPDLSERLARREGAFDVPTGRPWEVQCIELLTDKIMP